MNRRLNITFQPISGQISSNRPVILPSQHSIHRIDFFRTILQSLDDINDQIEELMGENENEDTSMSDDMINEFKEIKVDKEMDAKQMECSICLETFKEGDTYIMLPCKDHPHYFHNSDNEHCPGIIPWLKKNNTCPVCRFEFPKKKETNENDEFIQEEGNETNSDEPSDTNVNEMDNDPENDPVEPLFHSMLTNTIMNSISHMIDRNEDRDLQRAIQLSLEDQ